VTTDYTSQIDAFQQAVSYTNPTPTDLAIYNTELNSGTPLTGTSTSLAQQIVNSPFVTNTVDPVIALYLAVFNHLPDAAGLAFNVKAIEAGLPLAPSSATDTFSLVSEFVISPEFQTRFGSFTPLSQTTPALVYQLYTNILQRVPDAAGLQYWISQPLNVQQLVAAFALPNLDHEFATLVTPEIKAFELAEISGIAPIPPVTPPVTTTVTPPVTTTVTPPITTTVTPPVTTTVTPPPGDIGVGPPPPPVINHNFTLTTGTDHITGSGYGGDTISAPAPAATLTAGDTIIETGAGNLLTAILTDGATPSGLTISDVQTFSLTDLSTSGTTLSGTISGLTTVNDVDSTSPVTTLGSTSLGLATALTAVNISGETSTHSFSAFIKASALSGTADSIAVGIDGNFGTEGASSTLAFSPDSGTNGYESYALTVNGTSDYIALSQGTGHTLNTIILAGSGNVELDALDSTQATNLQNLATIDASAETGNVTITGLLGVTNGSGAGLLSVDTSLTSVKLGAGDDIIDLSNLTLAQEAQITTLDGGAGTDTVVFSNALLNSISTTALTETNFEVIGINYTGGTTTIDASMLGTGITTIKDFSTETGDVVLTNVASGFTFDAEQFGELDATLQPLTVSQPTSATGTSDVFNLIEGSSVANAGTGATGALGVVTINGFETLNITSQGASGLTGYDDVLSINDTVTGTSAAVINIGGTQNFVSFFAIQELGSTGTPSSTTLNITDTGSVIFNGTNITTINGASSGGVIEIGNFTGVAPGLTTSGTAASTIVGSATAHNQLVGGVGNDTFTGGSAGDIIVTNGGADTVNLGVPGSTDAVYIGQFNVLSLSGAIVGAPFGSVGAFDIAQPGFFGIVPGGTPTAIGGVAGSIFGTASSGGTSVDQVKVANFTVGTGSTADTLVFSDANEAAGGSNALGGVNQGLTGGDLATAPVIGDATVQIVAPGDTVSSSTNLIELTGTFANAAAVASALHTSSYGIFIGTTTTPTANGDAHILVAYSDGANVHIADVDFIRPGSSTVYNEYASDLVQLTGVASVTSLVGANVHFIA
jgi:hypothetical protein